jgi:hypothetical protein
LFGFPITEIASIDSVNPANLLIIGNLDGVVLTSAETNQLQTFLSRGGHVLILHPKRALADLFPDQIKVYKAKEGEIVTMRVPESPVFSGIEPLDIAWFDRGDGQLRVLAFIKSSPDARTQ